MLRHRKTSQKSKGAAEKKTFLFGLLYFGEQEDVRMFFFNLVLLMRFLSILSFSLARKNTWKGFFKLLDFPKTILPPLFQVSSFGKCWSASGLPDRRFARSSRFADWCSKKNFEAKSKLEYTIVFSSCKRSALPPPTTCWLPFQLTGDWFFIQNHLYSNNCSLSIDQRSTSVSPIILSHTHWVFNTQAPGGHPPPVQLLHMDDPWYLSFFHLRHFCCFLDAWEFFRTNISCSSWIPPAVAWIAALLPSLPCLLIFQVWLSQDAVVLGEECKKLDQVNCAWLIKWVVKRTII